MSNSENRIQYEDEKVIIYKCGAIACPNESHFETFDKNESGKQRNLYLYCFNKIIQQLDKTQEENKNLMDTTVQLEVKNRTIIDSLQEENKKLREALEEIVNYKSPEGQGYYYQTAVNIASKALEGK